MKEILNSYSNLLVYCDKFWDSVSGKYPQLVKCHAGCSICCELQSVSAIEAYFIIQDSKYKILADAKGQCPFVMNNLCNIYNNRPLICRTHGLIFKSSEFIDSFSISCPYNFNDPEIEIDESYIMDIDKVTMKLAHLNLAFCKLIGKTEWVSQRFQLKNLDHYQFPPDLTRVEENE